MPQRFEQAVRILPPQLRKEALALPESVRTQAEEIRLHTGGALSVCGAKRESTASCVLTASDMRQTLENSGSLHTILESLRHGFVTLPGGHRMGVCGSAAVKDGQIAHIRDISSLCIRIAREKKGIADKLLPALLVSGKLPNTLILSPPGAGKTTLLRDLIRAVSDGVQGEAMRVSVADERGEIAACYNGSPQLDVGRHTDVMSGVLKAEAAMMMLRGMSPQVLALDEITAPEDAAVINACIGCGVTVLSTAHASEPDDLKKRPVYRGLLDCFDRIVVISGVGGARKYEVMEVREPCLPQSA